MTDQARSLPSIGECTALACAWEVMAPKPGNVHRSADFEASTLHDFITSAIVIAPVMQRASSLRIGELVLESVEATVHWVGTNTNLGLVLLLAPLAKAAAATNGIIDSVAVNKGLDDMGESDAQQVYRAISLVNPGGLGSVSRWDVADEPPADLMAAMTLAADRDAIALQYSNGFEHVLRFVAPLLMEQSAQMRMADAIVYTQMRTMAELPDSLIARKCGPATAQAAAVRAQQVLQLAVDSPDYFAALADFDFWLRADGNRRNPGTTADLIGAGLFVALRNGMIKPPLH